MTWPRSLALIAMRLYRQSAGSARNAAFTFCRPGYLCVRSEKGADRAGRQGTARWSGGSLALARSTIIAKPLSRCRQNRSASNSGAKNLLCEISCFSRLTSSGLCDNSTASSTKASGVAATNCGRPSAVSRLSETPRSEIASLQGNDGEGPPRVCPMWSCDHYRGRYRSRYRPPVIGRYGRHSLSAMRR